MRLVRLPYPARPDQEELIHFIAAAQQGGRHGVVEAPTGTGKTIAALVASLTTCRDDGRRLVVVTRTNSQHAQVVLEHKALVADGQEPGLLIPFMGRRQLCPLLKDDERFRDGTSEELGRLCRDAKAKAVREAEEGKPVTGACPYYKRLLEDGTGPVEALLAQGGMDGGTLGARVAACGSCPYEALKSLLPRAAGVVVPSIYLVDNGLRAVFHEWLGAAPDEVHLVVDEAHNLPEAARGHHSPRLTMTSLHRAAKEAEEFKDPLLAGRLLTTTVLHALMQAVHALADELLVGDEDGRVPPGALEEELMQRLGAPSPVIARAASDLETWGAIVRDERQQRGRLPRSYMGAVGSFLRFWLEPTEAPYAYLVTGGEDPAVEAFLLDPSHVLGWLHECASTLHMSGTLAPLDHHVARCGLPADTSRRAFSSPFDPAHLQVVGVHGLHRRWRDHQDDPRHAAAQQEAARHLLATVPGKTALFFPSHAMLSAWIEEGFLHGTDRPCYIESAAMDSPALARLVASFRDDNDATALLLGVLGGRLAEGIDFPGDALRNLLILGVPYPKPTARLQALVDHADRLHDGQGWSFAVHHPVAQRLRQAIGRLVRGPDDHGTAVILDERIARFRPQIPGLRMVDDVGDVGVDVVVARMGNGDGFVAADTLHRESAADATT